MPKCQKGHTVTNILGCEICNSQQEYSFARPLNNDHEILMAVVTSLNQLYDVIHALQERVLRLEITTYQKVEG